MCGRFTITSPAKIQSRFNTSNKLPLFKPNFNVAPSLKVPTITRNSPNKITMMKWGFQWKTQGFGSINIRDDSFKEKPFFRHFLNGKRCIMPADSFYEWGTVNLEGKFEKFPYNFYLEGREMFGFACIYNDLKDSEGETFYSVAIITTSPNELVKKVHNRMPVILSKKDEDIWLDPQNKDTESLLRLLKPYPAEKMKVHMVSKKVNSPANNTPDLIEEFKKEKKFSYGLLDTDERF